MSKKLKVNRLAKINDDTLSKIMHNKVAYEDLTVLIKFYSPSCPMCNNLKPQLNEILGEYADNDRFHSFAFDIKENPSWQKKMGFNGVPTIVLVKPDPKVSKTRMSEFEVLEEPEGTFDKKKYYHESSIRQIIERKIKDA